MVAIGCCAALVAGAPSAARAQAPAAIDAVVLVGHAAIHATFASGEARWSLGDDGLVIEWDGPHVVGWYDAPGAQSLVVSDGCLWASEAPTGERFDAEEATPIACSPAAASARAVAEWPQALAPTARTLLAATFQDATFIAVDAAGWSATRFDSRGPHFQRFAATPVALAIDPARLAPPAVIAREEARVVAFDAETGARLAEAPSPTWIGECPPEVRADHSETRVTWRRGADVARVAWNGVGFEALPAPAPALAVRHAWDARCADTATWVTDANGDDVAGPLCGELSLVPVLDADSAMVGAAVCGAADRPELVLSPTGFVLDRALDGDCAAARFSATDGSRSARRSPALILDGARVTNLSGSVEALVLEAGVVFWSPSAIYATPNVPLDRVMWVDGAGARTLDAVPSSVWDPALPLALDER